MSPTGISGPTMDATAAALASIDRRDNDVAHACAPSYDSFAGQLGILATCGSEGASDEQVISTFSNSYQVCAASCRPFSHSPIASYYVTLWY